MNSLCEMVLDSFEVPLDTDAECTEAASSQFKSIKEHTALQDPRVKHRSLE